MIIGEVNSLSISSKDKILNENSNMADKALRVIAVAYKDVEVLPSNIEDKTIEQNLIFVRTNSE